MGFWIMPKLAVQFYRKCDAHGIIGAAWEKGKPAYCPECGKEMRMLTKEEVREMEREM